MKKDDRFRKIAKDCKHKYIHPFDPKQRGMCVYSAPGTLHDCSIAACPRLKQEGQSDA